MNQNLSDRLMFLLFEKKDISSVVFFRIVFGLIMIWGVGKYLFNNSLYKLYYGPNFHLKYYGFEWVQLIPTPYLKILFYSLVVLSIFIAIGLFYRISTTLFFLGFSYIFLLDMSYFLNHYYLVILISFLMIFIPANRTFSIDSLIWPKIKSEKINSWCIYVLMFQLGIVYFYGGIAKLNYDYVVRAEPVGIVLHNNFGALPIIGNYFKSVWMAYLFAYAGLLFDLLIVPFLLWSKTRIYAYVICVIFHLLNFKLFSIGIFPWFMIFATLLFFPPSWPRKLPSYFSKKSELEPKSDRNTIERSQLKKATILLLSVYILFQVSVPLRHHLYPGNVHWSDQGYYFSWLMIGRTKESKNIFFTATDPDSGKSWEIDAKKYLFLNSAQYDIVTTRPYAVVRLAHFFAEKIKMEGYDNIKIRANIQTTLNGRKFQYLIDPAFDLASVDPGLFKVAEWVVPLKNSLPPRRDNIIHNYLEKHRPNTKIF